MGNQLELLAVLAGTVALALEYGVKAGLGQRGYLHIIELAAVGLLWAGKICDWLYSRRQKSFSWSDVVFDVVLLLIAVASLWFMPDVFGQTNSAVVRWAVVQIYLLVLIFIYLGRLSVRATAGSRAPTRVLLLSFITVILTGAVLLMLPGACRSESLGFTDAVFTATSATCVTGLIVRDTGSEFTGLGRGIILVMIQIGGLGIMIFGALFAMLLGSRLTLRESMAMGDIMQEQSPGRIGRIVVFICIVTFLLELLGVLGLYGMWQPGGPSGPGRIFTSIFHSVSAFCNAGFSLQSDSFGDYRSSCRLYMIVCPLIVIGGLGFPVLHNLWDIITCRWHRARDKSHRARFPVRLSLHSKIALTTTAILLIVGWFLMMALEWARPEGAGAVLGGGVWLDGLFNSITARTAGFNTVSIADLSAGSKLVLILLMSIGGSPCSTAGGIKTVTFAVIVLVIYSTMRRRQDVGVFHRTLPVMIIRRAATLIALYGLLLWLVTLLLTITEHSLGADMLDLLFEAASALGTVGLSTGVTEHLTGAGKWVIITAMFVGRLGPLSLLMALTFNAPPSRYEYPREPLVVG